MREIKFRAWISKNSSDYLADAENCFIMGWQDSVFTQKYGFNTHGHEFITLEQYTGLKDKNGVDIYEGDIVKGDDICGYECDAAEIFFNEGAFSIRVDSDYWPCLFESAPELSVEVIGNIHENRGLLH